MEMEQLAHKCLKKRFVALVLEPRDAETKPYAFSSFLVEIADVWFLVTAAHCAQNVLEILRNYQNSAIALIVFQSDDTTYRIEVPRASWQYVDLQRSLREAVKRDNATGISNEEVDLYDLAIWPVPPLIRSYLQNAGVEPFAEGSAIFDQQSLANRLNDYENGFFAAGIPDLTHDVDLKKKTMKMFFVVLPLHPYPDFDLPGDQVRRELSSVGKNFFWIPTSWHKEQWNYSIRGVSGGPVILVSGEQHYLMGVVAQEKRAGGMPTYLGMASAEGLFAVMKNMIIADATPEVILD